MPYRRKYKRPRKIYKKRYARRKKCCVPRGMRPEVKYFDSQHNSSFSYNGTMVEIAQNIAAGTSNFTRVGSKIKLRSLDFRFTVTGNSATALPGVFSTSYRMLIIRGVGENGAPLTVNDVFSPTGLGSSNSPCCPFNWDKRRKFHVLKDIKGEVASGWATAAATNTPSFESERFYHIRVPLKDIVTQFQGTTTTIQNHGLYILFISDIASNLPVYAGTWRLTYDDA